MNKIRLLVFIKILVIETNSTTTIRLQHKAQHLSQLKPLEAAFKNLHSYINMKNHKSTSKTVL